MAWRIGGLLVITGIAFAVLLRGAFAVVGFGCIIGGALVLAAALRLAWFVPPVGPAHPSDPTVRSAASTDASNAA
jgi:hypothetical protein